MLAEIFSHGQSEWALHTGSDVRQCPWRTVRPTRCLVRRRTGPRRSRTDHRWCSTDAVRKQCNLQYILCGYISNLITRLFLGGHPPAKSTYCLPPMCRTNLPHPKPNNFCHAPHVYKMVILLKKVALTYELQTTKLLKDFVNVTSENCQLGKRASRSLSLFLYSRSSVIIAIATLKGRISSLSRDPIFLKPCCLSGNQGGRQRWWSRGHTNLLLHPWRVAKTSTGGQT